MRFGGDKNKVATLLVASQLILGCSAPTTVEQAQQQDKVVSTAAGAGIGAAVGCAAQKVWNAVRGKKGDCAEGAVVGAVGRAVAGHEVGSRTAEKRGEYARSKESVESEIAAEESRIAELVAQASQLQAEANARKTELSSLRGRLKNKQLIASRAREMLKQVESDLQRTRSMKAEVQTKLQLAESQVREARKANGVASQAAAEMKERNGKLVSRRDELMRAFNSLNGVERSLVAQGNQLSAMSKS